MLKILSFSHANNLLKGIVLLLNIVIFTKGYTNESYYVGLVFTIPAALFIFRRFNNKNEKKDIEPVEGKHSYLYYRNKVKKTHL